MQNEIEKMPKTVLGFFWKIIKPYRKWYLLMILGLISCGLQPLLYLYFSKIFINFLVNPVINDYDFFHPIIGFVLCEFYLQISWRIHNYATWQFGPSIYLDITDTVFDYVTHHSYIFFQNNLSGSIVIKVKGISDSLYNLNNAIGGDMMHSLFKLLFLGIGLCISSYEIFIILIFFIAIKVPLYILFFNKLAKVEEDCQMDWYNLTGLIADNLTNISSLFAFSTRDRERKKIWNYFQNTRKPLLVNWHKYDFWLSTILSFINIIFIIFFAIYLMYLKKRNLISIGDIGFIILSINIFLDNIFRSVNGIKDFLQKYAQAKVSYSIISTPQDTMDPINAKEMNITAGDIEFKNVSFNSDEQNSIFSNLNFHIKSGEKIGIVGMPGAGKFALLSLLMKNFRSQSGDIIIDGESIYNISSDSLRNQISYIPQEIILFNRSIGENIGYAKEDPNQIEIIQAAENVSMHKYIISLPKKYNTLVGEGGIKLTIGQRQKIAIARELLKNAPILILDEAISALDSVTEKELQTALWNLMKNKTCLVVAYRTSTLLEMDRILVFDQGKIVQDGSHTELSKQDGIYKHLWSTQTNGFILIE